MKIETKFDKGDVGYIIHNNKIYSVTIEPFIQVDYTVYYNGHTQIDEDGFEDIECDIDIVGENEIYATKEEAEAKLKEIGRISMKTTKTNKNNEIQIGDKVKFVVGTSLLTGVITKFYKNSYGDEECSVKTELNTLSGKINQKIFPHILLHRVSKIEEKDEVEVVREMRQQIVDLEQENKQLKEQLAEKELEAIRWEEHFNNVKMDYKCLEEAKNEEVTKLREQLAYKDKEIESLARQLNLIDNNFRGRGIKQTGNLYDDIVLHIRKQVCDEIREKLMPAKNLFTEGQIRTIKDILRITEQGGQNENEN